MCYFLVIKFKKWIKRCNFEVLLSIFSGFSSLNFHTQGFECVKSVCQGNVRNQFN